MKNRERRQHFYNFFCRIPADFINRLTRREKVCLVLLLTFVFDYALPSTLYFHGLTGSTKWLLQENGPYENLGAVAPFIGSIVLVRAYIKYPVGDSLGLFGGKRNIFLLLLALFMFFVAGEEISWGQRLFGFSVPELISQINFQRELNIHNLKIIQESNNALAISATRLLLAYVILLPMILSAFPAFKRLFISMGIPFGSIQISLLALANYFIHVYLVSFDVFKKWTHDGLGEVFETNLEIVLLALAFEIHSSARERWTTADGKRM
ncbi:MAG: hypothetical protein GY849_21450 [Deltaproteobacteria bacterium]|nr:hypothetical protein [Deltaproteobacteria bacterium]